MSHKYVPTAFNMDELENMYPQDVFDHCARHLFNQGEQSICPVSDDNCAYRGVDGAMCAAGIFIPDSVYRPFMDELPSSITDLGTTDDRHNGWVQKNEGLLADLQGLHDTYAAWGTTGSMRESLAAVGCLYDLNISTLDTLSFADR